MLVVAVPLVVLGWLGRRTLLQERDIERLSRIERLNQISALLTRELAAEAERWRTAAPKNDNLPRHASEIVFVPAGIVEVRGEHLPYIPVVAADKPRDEAARRRVQEELQLAREQRSRKKLQAALATYEQLSSFDRVRVAGFPAPLIAARERSAIFAELGNASAAARERDRIATALSTGQFLIDRSTFDVLASDFEGLKIDAHLAANADALIEAWPRLQQTSSGALVIGSNEFATAVVWGEHPSGSTAVIAPADELAEPAMRSATELGVTLTLLPETATARAARTDDTNTIDLVTRSTQDMGLSATLQVTSAADRGARSARERVFIGGFLLLAIAMIAAAYFSARLIHRELSLARQQADFVATVSHEFRSPLTAMRHLTETLEDGAASADRLPDYYRALSKETRRLQGTVESVLDFGRLESGRRAFELKDLDAVEVARDVAGEFTTVDANRLELSTPGSAAMVRADRDALVLALRNVIDNALKYSSAPEPVTMTVSVDERNGEVHIAVRDRGPGMTPEEQRDVFNKFVRGSAARLLNVKGTGLGLAMVDRIVRAHGGRVDVESRPNLGTGSVVTIALPHV